MDHNVCLSVCRWVTLDGFRLVQRSRNSPQEIQNRRHNGRMHPPPISSVIISWQSSSVHGLLPIVEQLRFTTNFSITFFLTRRHIRHLIGHLLPCNQLYCLAINIRLTHRGSEPPSFNACDRQPPVKEKSERSSSSKSRRLS